MRASSSVTRSIDPVELHQPQNGCSRLDGQAVNVPCSQGRLGGQSASVFNHFLVLRL